MDNLPEIREIIIVEGRDDTNAINRAVRAVTIETHGFGISEETWKKIDHAYEEHGIIIFTDPDHAGKEIRRRLKERYPNAKEAFLSVKKAGKRKKARDIKRAENIEKAGTKNSESKGFSDIGIENASPEDIREALSKVWSESRENDEVRNDKPNDRSNYAMKDLEKWNLVGMSDSTKRREILGDLLGIGYYNAKGLLRVLNGMKVPRDAFDEAVEKLGKIMTSPN